MELTQIDKESLKFFYDAFYRTYIRYSSCSKIFANMTLLTITDSVILPYIQGYLLLATRVQERQPSKSLAKRSHAMLVPVTRRCGRGVPQFMFFITTLHPPHR